MRQQDIIAAIASPAGISARIILRLSGPGSLRLVSRVTTEQKPLDAGVHRVRLRIEGMVFPATLLANESPRGYTGEESAEMHLPGNPLLARLTLEALYREGARPAEAGEFTARAFLNGRLDLSEAEGVAATIAATNERELAAARRLQDGELTRALHPILDELVQTLSLVEAGIDFSEEDIRFITRDDLLGRVKVTRAKLRTLVGQSRRLESLAHEPTIVLCGRPNAGKSTLLNAIAGRQRAIVSPEAGTTRDLLSAEVELASGLVRVIDTAGLEQVERTEADAIARQMQAKAVEAVRCADVVVLIIEAGDDRPPLQIGRDADLVVRSKCDRSQSLSELLHLSARTGEGMSMFQQRLNELAFERAGAETLALNARHLRLIKSAQEELALIEPSNEVLDELVAEHLRYAIDALGEISGVVSADDVLGRIFSSFCIGK